MNIDTCLPEVAHKLSIAEPTGVIDGEPFYNILENDYYAEKFGYIGPHVPNRRELETDEDISNYIMVMINIQYIPESIFINTFRYYDDDVHPF